MKIVGCFLEHNGAFLILLRHAHKPSGNTWGLPAGKVEPGEEATDAMLRELQEETGYKARKNELEHLGDFPFVGKSAYTFGTYRIKLKDLHDVALETSAHSDYKWVTAETCYAMHNLIPHFHELLRLVGYV